MLTKIFGTTPFVLSLFCAVAFAAQSASAQTNYNWSGTGSAAAANWNDATDWDQPTAPGSALNGAGALDDNVVIENQRATAVTQQIRLMDDAGVINNLSVGSGNGGNVNATTQLQIRANGDLEVAGITTLGAVRGTTQNAGSLVAAGGALTLSGDVVSGSTNGGNSLNVTVATSTLTIGGDIDSSAARAAAGLANTNADNEIDLNINRGTDRVQFTPGAHELNVERLAVATTTGNVGNVFPDLRSGHYDQCSRFDDRACYEQQPKF